MSSEMWVNVAEEETMAPRINSLGLCVVVVLCILLIFASNRISLLSSSPSSYLSSSADSPSLEFSRTFNVPNDRFYQLQSDGNSFDMNVYTNGGRSGSRYNKIMHPHNTEQRSQYYHRKYGGSNINNNNNNNNQLNAEMATVLTTNNDVVINTTVRIEDVVDAQRQRIAMKMKDFEYTEDMQGGLLSLTPETNGQPLRSVILSTWRSGSTFLGDILNAMPANYYHYEPLLHYDIVQIRGPPQADAAVETLRQLLKCNYTQLADYLDYGQNHNYLFSHNVRLWRNCRMYPQFCYDAQFLNAFCRLFPLQSMKVVRLRLALAETLLKDDSLNVRIVLLVRDPRGTIQSRKHREWCPGQPDCDNSTILCNDMVADFKAARAFAKRYPTKFKAVRYEDLSLQPFKMTKEILNFYGLPFDPEVEEFLDSHTRTDIGGVSSTFRDSKTAPFHWMRDLSFTEVEQIQLNCMEAMSLWGYKETDDEIALLANTFNPILKFPFA